MWPIKQKILTCSPSPLAGEGRGEGSATSIEITFNNYQKPC